MWTIRMAFLRFLLVTLLSALGVGTASAAVSSNDVYIHNFKTIDGEPMPLAQYRGKVLLIVNTASRCGFTPQYAGLETLYETYKDKGLVVIGVPSDDFGGQEPGSEKDIREFTSTKFHVTFPLTSKEDVRGKSAHPFFQQIRSELGVFAPPSWNFYKYLVSRDGHIVNWYSSKTTPDSDALKADIERELDKKGLD